MLRQLSEEAVLFVHVLKWLLLAATVGFLVGLTSTGFILLLSMVIDGFASAAWGSWLLPFGLALSAWVTSSLVPEAGGQGVERVVRAIHLQAGKISWQVIPAKIGATILTIGTGGSAGNVGPCVQIGSGLSAWVADLLQFESQERKTLVICGLSAGFAAIFGTPLAGAIFGMEALFVGSLAYHVLFPSAVASLVGYLTAMWLNMPSMNFHAHLFPSFDLTMLTLALIAGAVFGMVSLIFVECLNGVKRLAYALQTSPIIQGFFVGWLLLGLGTFISPHILGLGKDTIQTALQGQGLGFALVLSLGKMLTTSLTLRFGGSGGIVLPICFVGATSGAFLGGILNQDPSLFAALGLVGLLAGAINTPLTAILLGMELFGVTSGPYLLLTCTVAFLLSGHRSAIPTQLLQLHKAPALRAKINEEVGEEGNAPK
jgi:H+/Cl- antiporter ClcA